MPELLHITAAEGRTTVSRPDVGRPDIGRPDLGSPGTRSSDIRSSDTDTRRPPFLTIDVRGDDMRLLITLSGEIDADNLDMLRDALARSAGGTPPLVVVALDQLDFLSAAAARLLLDAQEDLAASGGRMLLSRATPAVRHCLHLTEVFELVELLDDRAGQARCTARLGRRRV